MNDYLRMRDLAHVPMEMQALYENGTPVVPVKSIPHVA
jgi:hypothetical protein